MPFWKKKSKEQNLKDALETAYLTLKQHTETAERENIYYDGDAEKRSIIDILEHYYHLSPKDADDVYIEAVRQMDKDEMDKHGGVHYW